VAGLRTRKKWQTEQKLWKTAVGLFAERGFEKVSVAEIAAAAEVSTMTVFNYFPAKEDLVMRPLEQHIDELAQVVRDRADGQSAVEAIREQFLDALGQFDPSTGLNDDAQILAVVRLIHATPSLRSRTVAVIAESEEFLSAQLQALDPAGDLLLARAASAQLTGARRVLIVENQRLLLAGGRARALLETARDNAVHVFGQVESGLGDYGRR